jgi:hypothetical protein
MIPNPPPPSTYYIHRIRRRYTYFFQQLQSEKARFSFLLLLLLLLFTYPTLSTISACKHGYSKLKRTDLFARAVRFALFRFWTTTPTTATHFHHFHDHDRSPQALYCFMIIYRMNVVDFFWAVLKPSFHTQLVTLLSRGSLDIKSWIAL